MAKQRHEKLWKAYHADRSDANRNALTLAYEPLAKWFATYYSRRARLFGMLDSDDALQESLIGLQDAVETFDPKRETQFSTHAIWKMKCKVVRLASRCDWRLRGKHTGILNAKRKANRSGKEHPEASDLQDESAGPIDDVSLRERAEWVSELIRYLPARLTRLIRMRFFEYRTLDEVGQELGVSKERARQLEEMAIEKLLDKAPYVGCPLPGTVRHMMEIP